MRPDNGFTLVEIMMTIALLGIIAMAATPLAGSMLQSADLTKTEGLLSQAVGKAKAVALRNSAAATGDTPVAAICISNTNLLTVEEGIPGTSPNCSTVDGNVVWTAQLSSSAVLKTDENNVFVASSCMCYSNKGLLEGSACSVGDCVSSSVFQITVGSHSPELVSIY